MLWVCSFSRISCWLFSNHSSFLTISGFSFLFSSLSWKLYLFIPITSLCPCLIHCNSSTTSIIIIYFYLSICVSSTWSSFITSCLTITSAIFSAKVITYVFCFILSYFIMFPLVALRTLRFPTSFFLNPISSWCIICWFYLKTSQLVNYS